MARARVFLACVLTACAGPRLPDALAAAQARELAHDSDGAEASYRAMLADCVLPKDDCATAQIRLAELLEHLGREPEAIAAWLAVPARTTQPLRMARATAHVARLLEHREPHRAEELAERALRRWPDEVPTDDALRVWVRLIRARAPEALIGQLTALWLSVKQTDLGDNVLFALGEAQEPSAPGDAVRTWDRLVAEYRRSGLRDDALWRAAALLRKTGLPKEALIRLQTILDSRRDALITGSYNSIWLDDAQLLKGQILLEDLGDLDAAAVAFRLLADDYPESVLRDDGLYFLAEVERRRGEVPAACKTLKRLVDQFPDSNQRRSALQQRRQLACLP